jgi:hypothetical protein
MEGAGMKRFLLVALLFVVAMAAQCTPTLYRTEADFMWDAVTQGTDNLPFDATDVLTYQVYRAADPVVVRQDTSQYIMLGEVSVPLLHVIIPAAGKYAYAVRAKLLTDEGQTTLYSQLSWSDVPGDALSPFLCKRPRLIGPKNPKGLAGQ